MTVKKIKPEAPRLQSAHVLRQVLTGAQLSVDLLPLLDAAGLSIPRGVRVVASFSPQGPRGAEMLVTVSEDMIDLPAAVL